MSIKKWIPWNWFKKEEDGATAVPVKRAPSRHWDAVPSGPLAQFHKEVDRLFEQAFRGFGLSTPGFDRPLWPHSDGMLKQTLDLDATEKAYTISVEVPCMDEKDVKVEIANDTLTIRGEKKQENEEQDRNYYRMERSYGSFQRVLSLPEDADQEAISAGYKNGVLTVSIPRKPAPQNHVRQIQIQGA